MGRFGAAGLTLALLGLSCKITSEVASSVCKEGLASRDGGVGGAGPSDGGDEGGFADGGPADGGPEDGGSEDAGGSDAGQQEGGLDGGSAYCASCQPQVSCGTVQIPAVVAVAGVAASAAHPHAFYLHNGPPDVARFFAVGDTGADLGTYNVTGAANVDWEDVAVGPCPGGSCVFLADIGDAHQVRGQYAIYRVREPTALAAGVSSVTADVFPFSYPDGSHDAAAILVHPFTGIVTVVTRDDSGAGTLVYELPATQPGQPVTATARGVLAHLGPGVAVTAGSVGHDGRVLLRTTKGAIVFDAPAGDAGVVPTRAAFDSASCPAVVARETDGEAIAWIGSGGGYLTLDRRPAPALSYVFCAAP